MLNEVQEQLPAFEKELLSRWGMEKTVEMNKSKNNYMRNTD